MILVYKDSYGACKSVMGMGFNGSTTHKFHNSLAPKKYIYNCGDVILLLRVLLYFSFNEDDNFIEIDRVIEKRVNYIFGPYPLGQMSI